MITFTTSEIAIFRKTKSVIINVALVFSVLMFTNISIQARGAPESFATTRCNTWSDWCCKLKTSANW